MITPHARRPSDRHRHLPLHRRRGLDEAPARARCRGICGGARRAPARDPRGLRRPGRSRGRHAGDAFFFAFPTAPRALAAAQAMTEALAAGPDPRARRPAHGDAARDRGGLRRRRRALRRTSRRVGHGGQVRVSQATRAARRWRCSHRPRRAPPEGHRGCRARSTNSATKTSRRLRRSRTRTCRARRAPSSAGSMSLPRCVATSSAGDTTSHAHRPRRLRKDAARGGGRGRARPLVQGRASSGSGSLRSASHARARTDRVRRSERRTASPSTSASGRCFSSSTTWSR